MAKGGIAAKPDYMRYYGLDILKICAIVLIAMHHFQQDFWVTYSHINFYGGRFYFGYAVELFFVISGFVTVASESNKDQGAVVRPFLHRLKRLWPPAAVSVLVATALWPVYHHFSGLWWSNHPLSLKSFFLSLSTISQGAVVSGYSYNNPLWYVGVLIICYAAFYLLRRLSKVLHIPSWVLFAALSLIGFWGVQAQIDVPFLAMSSSARGYAAFFLGVLLGMIVPRAASGRRHRVVAIVAGIVAFAACVGLYRSDTLLQHEWLVEMCLVWPELVLLVTLGDAVQRLGDNLVVAFLGRINYEFYVWHSVVSIVIATVCAALGVAIPTSRLDMLLYLLLCGVVATVMYYAVERPLAKVFR
jgi:peptidoglycan/LPS O-acetylase OafA/YrhL